MPNSGQCSRIAPRRRSGVQNASTFPHAHAQLGECLIHIACTVLHRKSTHRCLRERMPRRTSQPSPRQTAIETAAQNAAMPSSTRFGAHSCPATSPGRSIPRITQPRLLIRILIETISISEHGFSAPALLHSARARLQHSPCRFSIRFPYVLRTPSSRA